MSTLDISKKEVKRTRIIYIAGIVFCIVFAAIYEYFSHNVYSLFMILSFSIPLAGWLLTEITDKAAPHAGMSGIRAREFIAGAVFWLTLGMIYSGVLEIYGTTNKKTAFFFIIGGVQLLMALVACSGIFSSGNGEGKELQAENLSTNRDEMRNID